MEQRQLNFAEKSVQVLTLEELEKSYHENLTTGEPVGGIYHFALIQEVRRESVERMKSALMDREAMLRLIGVLVEKRILHDTACKQIHDGAPYPLNSGQINETAEQLMLLFSGYRTQGTGTLCSASYAQMSQSPCAPSAVSYWDAYQRLNTVLKPDRMDIPQVIPQSLALFETMEEEIKNKK